MVFLGFAGILLGRPCGADVFDQLGFTTEASRREAYHAGALIFWFFDERHLARSLPLLTPAPATRLDKSHDGSRFLLGAHQRGSADH